MSNFITQAEIFQALLNGKLITNGDSNQPIRLNDEGMLTYRDVPGVSLIIDYPSDWSIYEEPKPKKQVWQWRFKGKDESWWGISSSLMDENEVKKCFGHIKYEKHAGPFEVED